MTEPVTMKICSRCKTEIPADAAHFHIDRARADGWHRICKECRKVKHKEFAAAVRREGLLPEEQKEWDRLDLREAKCHADLDDPSKSAATLRQAEIDVRKKIPKQRAELQKQIDERLRKVRADELAKRQQGELILTRELFPAPEVLPIGAKRDALLRRLQEHSAILEGEDFNTARAYLAEQAAHLKSAIDAERQKELARVTAMEQTQAEIEKAASNAAAEEIFDWARPFLLAPTMDLKKRDKLRVFCLEQAEKSKGVRNKVVAARMQRAYTKLARMLEIVTQDSLPPTDSNKFETSYYTSGFSTSTVNWNFRTSNEKALLRHFTLLCIGDKYASELPDAPPVIWTPKLPTDRLDNILSRIDEANLMAPQLEEQELRRQKYWEELKRTNPKLYEKESRNAILQIKGDDIWAQRSRENWKQLKERNPEEFERLSLAALEPQNFELPQIIYLLPVWTHANPKARDQMRWPGGAVVQPHEVAYDYRTKTWNLPAEVVDAELNFNKQSGPTAAELARMSPESAEFYRDVDAPTASKLFAKPVPITFRRGDRHVEGSGRDVFRHGHFWTADEVRRAETGYSEKPPIVLPPLPLISISDSFAVKVETEAELAKWKEPIETPWMKWERKQREQKEREQQLLN